ncbi:LamB/YcsF family protein [Arthrobacter sp. zg-Y769]|uniref:LamB/YcsF family protein n=1 Tax=Arthrobacter sp. zg-Y769 TaxID=2894191 RepID=UPI001E2D11AC|nr:5-oxoprolinase subunit PxpA [Arthrobacter sp. zg-Y769]MCC9206247.1 LamB/YcsF family protein [Arthrobacter sp. zg-Y769]
MPVIDLNSDVGESFGNWTMGDDAAIFESVSSANVACGFHAGDPSTIAQTCRDAVAAGVTIGAHVAYRDLAGFGRRFLDCSYTELLDDVLYQLGALQGLARAAGSEVRYVKPHGALYNTIVRHEVHARAVVDAVRAFDKDLPVLLLPGAVALEIAADSGLRGVAEAFADRNYNPDGTLVSRREPNAVISDAGTVTANMVRLATQGTITAVDGTEIPMQAESICVHGDTPGAVAMAKAVRAGLENAGVSISSFV